MKKSLVRKVFIYVFCIILLVIDSEKLIDLFQKEIDKFLDKNIIVQFWSILLSFLIVSLFVIDFIVLLNEIINKVLALHSNKIWRDVQSTYRNQVLHYINNTQIEDKSYIKIEHLMLNYCFSDLIYENSVCKITQLFETSSSDKEKKMISFFLLDNSYHNSIAFLLSENVELRNQCEKISKEISKKIVEHICSKREPINENDIDTILVGLLHICLPGNYLNKEDFIYFINKFLSWVNNYFSTENVINFQDFLSLFIVLMPSLKRKLKHLYIDDKNIREHILRIEKSKWLKHLIDESYNQIKRNYSRKQQYFLTTEQCARNASVLNLYYDKLSLNKKFGLNKIINKNKINDFNVGSNEKILSFIFVASSISKVSSSGDIIYKVAELIFLSSNNYFLGNKS